jgi:hypothetical protein
MTNFIRSMYARKAAQAAEREKNPNRVLGGLKGHGADHYSILGEDGQDRQVPTRAYVQGLEEKIRKLEERLNEQDKRIRKLNNG